jgi:hypothetical protein
VRPATGGRPPARFRRRVLRPDHAPDTQRMRAAMRAGLENSGPPALQGAPIPH